MGFIYYLIFSCFSFTEPTTIVYRSGEAGYKCFRIPAIVKAPNGELLAFCEARRQDCGDFGDVDIVLKKSNDNGKSWRDMQLVVDFGGYQAGNPAPVYDLSDPSFPKGRLFLFYNTGVVSENDVRQGKAIREVWFKTSTDNGQTWSVATNITLQVNKPQKPDLDAAYDFADDWRSYANTPGHALQIEKGSHRGRILVAANHSAGSPKPHFKDYNAHAYYTDDHGKIFKISPDVAYEGSNEATAAETSDGGVLLNCRNQSGDVKCRIQAYSKDAGQHWDSTQLMTSLLDPVCQGSMINFRTKKQKNMLLFSNLNSQSKREKLAARYSTDDGRTWSAAKEIYSGSAAYSDLVVQQDQRIGLLFEQDDYTKISYTSFSIEWLTQQP